MPESGVTLHEVPVLDAYCTEYPLRSTVVDPALNNSIKSCVYVAPLFPPPPYTWLMRRPGQTAGGQAVGAVVSLTELLTQLVVVLRQRAYTVKAEVVYAGAVVDHGPFASVAYSKTVPGPQPLAEIVPVTDGHTLLVMTKVGASGVAQVPGAVVTPVEAGLKVLASESHKQRVWMVRPAA